MTTMSFPGGLSTTSTDASTDSDTYAGIRDGSTYDNRLGAHLGEQASAGGSNNEFTGTTDDVLGNIADDPESYQEAVDAAQEQADRIDETVTFDGEQDGLDPDEDIGENDTFGGTGSTDTNDSSSNSDDSSNENQNEQQNQNESSGSGSMPAFIPVSGGGGSSSTMLAVAAALGIGYAVTRG